MTAPAVQRTGKTKPWLPLLTFAAILAGLVLIGLATYHDQRDQARAEAEAKLQGIGELRVAQLNRWAASIRAASEFLSQGGQISDHFAAWSTGGFQDQDRVNRILARLAGFQKVFGFHSVSLFDTTGRYCLGDHPDPVMPEHRDDALQAMRQRGPVFVDFHQHGQDAPEPTLGLVVPMIKGQGADAPVVGAVFIKISPQDSLFPRISQWPTPSSSGETLLVRNQGERMQLIFASRSEPPSGLVSLRPYLPTAAIRTLRGERGLLRGTLDDRGVPVLAFGGKIPGTPWVMIAKLDQAEVDAPARHLAIYSSLGTLVLALLGAGFYWAWWRGQVQRQRAQLLGKEVERRVLERRYDTLSRYANDVILLTDERGLILEANDRVEQMYGYPRQELLGQGSEQLLPAENREDDLRRREAMLAAGRLTFETEHQRRDGSRFPVEINAHVIDLHGVRHGHLTIRDISERRQAEARLEHATHYDPLTGLANARKLLDDLGAAITAGATTPLALLVLNLDRFAQLNESLGRAAGDRVLTGLAQRWLSALPNTALLARLDADQFAVLLRDTRPEEKSDALVPILEIANSLLAGMAQPLPVGEEQSQVALTLSIGIAVYPGDAEHPAALLHAAEDAMREAKSGKGNQLRFFDRRLAQAAVDWFETEAALRQALDLDEFFLVYQPQVDATNGRIVAAESLIRWRHDGQVVPPGRFIHVVEGTDLAEPVSRWVLRTACRQAKQWLNRNRPVRVAVNIFSDHVTSGRLLDDVRQALSDADLPPALLEIEVVESSLLKNPETAAHTLREIKRLGVGLALDDFGTGYSSLGYLKHYPFDVLKIDQMFARNVTRDPDDAAIVRSTIALAHNLGMRVLAEGVETLPQLRFMVRYGCDQIQGYLTCRPTTPGEVETLVMERRDLRPSGMARTLPAPAVLVVEDEPVEAELLSLLLTDEGYHPHIAADLEGALEVMGRERIDLIIADHYLEHCTGVDVLERLRRLFPDVPRIMVSGAEEQAVVTEAVNRAGIRAFLRKPVNPDILLPTIHKLLEEAARG